MSRRLDINEDSYQCRYHKTPVAIEEQLKAERAGRDRNSKSGNHELRKKRHDVVTPLRGCDRIKVSTVDNEVVTQNKSRDIRFTID